MDLDLADLQHKIALVTGASSGLGREFCLQLALSGCDVVAAGRRTQLLQTLASEIQSFAAGNRPADGLQQRPPVVGKVAIVQMDVGVNEAAVDAAVEEAWQAFGRIDVLVNNAGLRGNVKSPLDLEEEEWNKVLATNLRGVWLVSKAVVNRMSAAKIHGSIINISSVAALERGLLPGALGYGVSKAAVNHLTKIMAMELGKHDVRVNSISPGLFLSEITSDLFKQSWVHEIAPKMVPLQRHGMVNSDLTSLVLLLASNCSSYITGNLFVVDGGQTIAGVLVRSSL